MIKNNKLYTGTLLLLAGLFVTGCSQKVLVEKEIYSPLPQALLVEPDIPPPPPLVITANEDELTQTRRHLNIYLNYARVLIKELQEITLNIRALKTLDAEKQKQHAEP